MAIKGKKRSRGGRSGRAIASAPRPTLVVRKKPLFRRTWFRVVLLIVVLGALGAASVAGWASYRDNQRQEAERRDVQRTGALIEGGLAVVGQGTPAGFSVLPQIPGVLAEIQGGEARERRVREQAAGWAESARQAAAVLAEIETDNARLRSAVDRMGEALDSYAELAGRVGEAAGLEGRALRRELRALTEELTAAQGTFDTAWFEYQAARQAVGLGGPEAPGGFGPPG